MTLGSKKKQCITLNLFTAVQNNVITVAPRYNEVSRHRKKCSNYLVNNKNIRYSGVTKLNQAEQWDIHHAKHSTDLRVNSYT